MITLEPAETFYEELQKLAPEAKQFIRDKILDNLNVIVAAAEEIANEPMNALKNIEDAERIQPQLEVWVRQVQELFPAPVKYVNSLKVADVVRPTLTEEAKMIVRDHMLNTLALIQSWTAVIQQHPTEFDDIAFRASSILRLLQHYENDFLELFYGHHANQTAPDAGAVP